MVPRGKPREEAVLEATRAVLAERGYAATTIDEIASRARASKATIYRRWPNKAELARAALDALDAATVTAIPDTGELRSDLLAALSVLRETATGPYVAMMMDLAAAARKDEALAAALHAHVADDELSALSEILRRAVRRRVVKRSVDGELIHDVTEAMLIRQLQHGLPLDDAFLERIVDRVILPLLPLRKGRT